MPKTKKTYEPRATDRLWGVIAVVAWIFIIASAGVAAAASTLLAQLARYDALEPMMDGDMFPGQELTSLAILAATLIYLLSYVVAAFLVLRWYLRSVRNAGVLHRGIETSPAWAIWGFIVPFISLFKPYAMTSELWRSSHCPDSWKGAKDPVLLRWWWGAVLVASIILTVSDMLARGAGTVGELRIAYGLMAAGFGLQALAGLLFLRIGGPISRRQTNLIAAGHRPPESTIPAWSA